MTNVMPRNDGSRPEMDALLQDYFQAEMPHPWPAFKTPRPMLSARPTASWARYSGRLAVAACIGLLVAGYLTLGGFFPHSQSPTGTNQVMPDLSHKEKLSKPVPSPIDNKTSNRKSK